MNAIETARAELAHARRALDEARRAEQEMCRLRLNAERELARAQDAIARLKARTCEAQRQQDELDALTQALAAAKA